MNVCGKMQYCVIRILSWTYIPFKRFQQNLILRFILMNTMPLFRPGYILDLDPDQDFGCQVGFDRLDLMIVS